MKLYRYQLNYNSFISDKIQSKFIKISNLNFKTTEKGTGCCACSKYEINSIDINDTAYPINQLPVLIKK
jgi:nitrous oxidase accessory protein NosD